MKKIRKKDTMCFERQNDAVGGVLFVVKVPEGVIEHIGLNTANLFGYAPKECIGRSAGILYAHEKDYKEFAEMLNTAAKKNTDGAHKRKLLKKKNGDKFPAEISISFCYEEESITHAIVMIRDITGRKKIQEALSSCTSKEKDIFLKEMHHRITNNLQTVLSMFYLASVSITDRQAVEVFKAIRNRIISIAFAHDMLYYNENLLEIEFCKYVRDFSAELMKTLGVDRSRIILKLNMENVNLDVDTAIPCGLIINEFISNSVKYAFQKKNRGKILVEMHSSKGRFTLILKDNGSGLPEGIDFSDKKTLGLRLIDNMVRQIGGKLNYEKGEGTKFVITFLHKVSDLN